MQISHLEDEIRQQPKTIQTLLESQADEIARICDRIRGQFRYIVIAARGTSDNAARYAQYLFGAHNHFQVALATPSLYTIYDTPPDLTGALVIGISQSGKSPDILAVLERGRQCGSPTLAITNDSQSPLAQISDYVIPIQAGIERSVAATKTYTCSLAAMAMVSAILSEEKTLLNEMQKLPSAMQSTIELAQSVLSKVQRYRYINRCSVLGRGFNYSTTFEIALKIKELTGVIAESYSTADFRHGPIATIKEGSPVIVVAPSGQSQADMSGLISDLDSAGAELIIISDQAEILEPASLPFRVASGLPEWLTPITYVIPGQLFALQLTIEKRLDIDHPEGLTKVTETY
jgi:glucosamine--fructose-6-phosphate aminotransferase (isomerizing)